MHRVPWWQHDLRICGFEGEGESDPEGNEGETTEEGEDPEDESTEEGTETGGEGESKGSDDVSRLKNALNAERRLNKQNTKLLKQSQKAEQERKDADLSEGQKSTKRAETAESKVNKLAEALKTNKLEQTIIAAARTAKFRDAKDALIQVDRSEIEVDQDEDNPENVTVDEDAVKKAVIALAKKKKYLVQDDEETEDNAPSGSQFNGKKKSKDVLDKEALEKKYPALRGV